MFDQAQARASCTPLLWGRSRSIPQCMVFDVEPLHPLLNQRLRVTSLKVRYCFNEANSALLLKSTVVGPQ